MASTATVKTAHGNKKTIHYEMWTKEDALQALNVNEVNRPIRYHVIEQYTGDMNSGKFESDQVLIFDWNGKMIDGQHRCTSFLKSDLDTITWPVVRGADPESQLVIDILTKRSLRDFLHLKGERSPSMLAPAIHNVVRILRDGMLKSRANISPLVATAILDQHPEIRTSVDSFLNWRPNNMMHIQQASLITGHWMIGQVNGPEEADAFLGRMMTLQGETAGSPILAMRKTVDHLFITHDTRRNSREEIRLMINCWNLDASNAHSAGKLEYGAKNKKPSELVLPEVQKRIGKWPKNSPEILAQLSDSVIAG